MSYLEDTLAAIHKATTFEELADLVDGQAGEIPTGETWTEAADRLAADPAGNDDLARILRAAAERWAELKAGIPPPVKSQASVDTVNSQGDGAQASTNPSEGSEKALRSQPALDTRPPSRFKPDI